jgi:trimethylamine--corrinoid protein Co-methyltransferase
MQIELNQKLLTAIHNHTIDILSRRGFRFSWTEAVNIFKKHGFHTSDDVVYFSGEQVERALTSVPSEVTILARDPQHNLKLDLDTVAFGLGRGAIYMLDRYAGHRKSTMADLIQASKLAQQLPEVQHWQPLVFPNDIANEHLLMAITRTMLKYQTKPDLVAGPRELELVLLAFGGLKIRDAIEMSRKGYSYGQATVNVLSPLTLVESACRVLVEFAQIGLATQITPMPLAGSTAPCTLLGVVIQQNCEVLAPLVLSQLINPGCPVLYGNMGCGSDMRTMGGSFGSPESRLIEQIAGKMAKHYGLLSRGGIGITDSAYEGFQAGAEALLQAQNAIACRSNLVIGMGIMGGYMGASLIKILLDAELVNYVRSFYRNIELSRESTAVDNIAEMTFDGNYVTSTHTLDHCRKEHYAPKLFERKTAESWNQNAHHEFMDAVAKKVDNEIDAYVPPAVDTSLATELDLAFGRLLPDNLMFDAA